MNLPARAIAPPSFRARRRKRVAAFSLTELLVSTAITSFAIAGIMTTFIAIKRGYAATSDSIAETNRFVVVQDQLGLDLRNAVSVVASDPDRLSVGVRYFSDLPGSSRLVTYVFDAGTGRLTRTADGNTYHIMSDLSAAVFTYYRRSIGGEVASTQIAAEVNAVQLTLTPQMRSGVATSVQAAYATALFQLRRIVFP